MLAVQFALALVQDAQTPANEAWFLQNARVVVRPGVVVENASIVLRSGKIVAVGANLQPPPDAKALDCTGLTAYAGFIHPFVRASAAAAQAQPAQGEPPQGDGAPAPPAAVQGRPQATAETMRRRDEDPFGRKALLLSHEQASATAAGLDALAKSGYALAHASVPGGIFGRGTEVFRLTAAGIDAKAPVARPGNIPVSLSARAGGGYPGSLMAAVAFARQALMDASWGARNDPSAQEPPLAAIAEGLQGKRKFIADDLNETTYPIVRRIFVEAGVEPVYGFRSGFGASRAVSGLEAKTVLLRGDVPPAPRFAEGATPSLAAVRAYSNEAQAAAEASRAGIRFCYAPGPFPAPLAGIRTYVRAGLSRDAALDAMTTAPAEMLGLADCGTLEPGKSAHVTLFQGDAFDSASQLMAVFVDGKRLDLPMPERKADVPADPPLTLPGPDYRHFPSPAETEPAFRLYRNATVWTMGPQGTLKDADVLIRGGKIEAVGRGLKAPAGCEVVEAAGKHISPGIWDAHSHTAIEGGVNEGSNMVTVECRIRDVVNARASGIYVQLSGGTVGSLQLHGSANAIGGQSNTVKWRWGLGPDAYAVEGAPEGVKFALGQNPIREDTGGANPTVVGNTLLTWRPRTRMGVEESIRRALQLGKEYNEQWAAYRAGRLAKEPRRDLQLEGLGEIVAGTRWVHSHGYRADEMLGLIRIVHEYGGKLATLQHVLEGYKIADEMAEAGVGGSTFSDWWGFKLESYDAIPHNASLMAERGVSVSVNSDSGDHARRLNQEAAKAIRYGGASAERALSFVTIEPCRQLGIDGRTGSIEPGKDADLAVWSAEPLSIFAVCLETYVDGVKRFDRADDARQREARSAELEQAKRMLSPAAAEPAPAAAPDEVAPTTVRFGIGPVRENPASIRYPRGAVLIAGATVHTMRGKPTVGDVLIGADGKIAAVGQRLNAQGATRIDARGKHLYPGLIDPVTTLGINEIGQVPASDDSSERGNFHPDYRVERTINPEWETLAVARNQGVLTAMVLPQGGGANGQAALIHTEGYTWEDLTIKGGAALAFAGAAGGFNFGEDDRCLCEHTEDHEHEHDEDEMTAGQAGAQQDASGISGRLAAISRQMGEAAEYATKLRAATPEAPVARDQRHEAMLQVASGQLPVMIAASSAADIRAAVEWAEKERVRLVLYGASGAGEIAEWLAAKRVPVCLAAVYQTPGAELPVDHFYSLPAKLSRAGVLFCLTTNSDKNVRQLRDQAGWAAAYGVDREEAARLVTLRAAEVLGIDDRLGAIAAGMDGTLILTDGEIIETSTRVLRAWILGREVSLENKQTRLYDKYRQRPMPARKAA